MAQVKLETGLFARLLCVWQTVGEGSRGAEGHRERERESGGNRIERKASDLLAIHHM